MVTTRYSRVLRVTPLLIALFALSRANAQAQNVMPVAAAGLSRYAATDPVQLNGTGSYDPDDSGPLSYAWQQVSDLPVIIIDANTATPTIAGSMVPGSGRDPTPRPGGFPQTDEIQECEFELVVSDGELTSLPDSVKVIIVPDFGESMLRLANDSFDPDKPTYVFFQGGDCIAGQPFEVAWDLDWLSMMNTIDFPKGYAPDIDGDQRTYYNCGEMIIVYLSSVAPGYKMPIQTSGQSTGGQPAIDVGILLNLTYQDVRYAVNRVTLFDATGYCRDYSQSIGTFLNSSVDSEQCWIDNYVGTLAGADPRLQYQSFHPNMLNVLFDRAADSSLPWLYRHELPAYWYVSSLTVSDMNRFNNGMVAGAYWSVAGPGKNLQLASTPGVETYKFTWYGDEFSGHMDVYDEPNHPGRLPEPVTLVGPPDGAVVDANGALFSCEESENAVGYQLLFGSNPYRVMDYLVVSDTPIPPVGTISEFPFEETWWTVRAYDTFGSTIYADPRCINAAVILPPMTLPHVLYIHEYDIEAAESYQSLLVSYGCPTTLIGLDNVATTPLDSYDLVIIGNDTGSLSQWGEAESVAAIESSGKPVLGLGEGGYAFFGKLGLWIGWPNGMHSSRDSIFVIDPNDLLFSAPYPIDVPEGRALQLYTETGHVGLHLWPVPETVTALGGELDNPGYYPLALEHDRYLIWGFAESPEKMTQIGKDLFINIAIRAANAAC